MPGFVPFCSQRRMMCSFCRFCPLVQSAKNMNKGWFVPFWHNKVCASAHIRPRRASLWNGFYLILWSTVCLSLIRKRRMPVGGGAAGCRSPWRSVLNAESQGIRCESIDEVATKSFSKTNIYAKNLLAGVDDCIGNVSRRPKP